MAEALAPSASARCSASAGAGALRRRDLTRGSQPSQSALRFGHYPPAGRAPGHRRANAARVLSVRASQSDETELAVFRFTLGIGDDRLIPRVVGSVGAALLVANHFAAAAPSAAQGRAEVVGALLAAACIATPALERRLEEAQKGVSGSRDVEGGAQVFALKEGLSEAARQELAWATFALLRNTNACTALVVRPGGEVWCARGAVGVEVGEGALQRLTEATKAAAAASAGVFPPPSEGVYLPDAGKMAGAGAAGWGYAPRGAKTALAVPAGQSGGYLVLLGATPRAFSPRERQWAAALANKLAALEA